MHTSVVFDNKIWVLGGFDGSNYLNDVWCSADGVNWTQATANAQWAARYGHTSVVLDNDIWVLGGPQNDVWYSADGESWTKATDSAGWSARIWHASVVFDSKVWVLGGKGSSPWNDVWYSSGLAAPAAPTPISPPSGHIVSTLRPTLQVQTVPGASQYDYRVYKGGSLVREGYTASSSWRVDIDLQYGATYEWDCRAQNGAGWGSYFSPRWSFTVSSSLPPSLAQYPMFRHDPQHTGRSQYRGTRTSDVRWFYYTTSPVISSPIVASDSTIYFVSENGVFASLCG